MSGIRHSNGITPRPCQWFAPMQPRASKRPVVLIVEDELLIRMNSMEMVEAAGFEVLEAENADDAIAVLEARNDIHLILTDVHMPGSMDGLKLAHFVRNRWPPVKIIATSGRALPAEGDLPDGARFLQKPYTATEITAVLQELIQ